MFTNFALPEKSDAVPLNVDKINDPSLVDLEGKPPISSSAGNSGRSETILENKHHHNISVDPHMHTEPEIPPPAAMKVEQLKEVGCCTSITCTPCITPINNTRLPG